MPKSSSKYLLVVGLAIVIFIHQSFTVSEKTVPAGNVLIKINLRFNGRPFILNNQHYITVAGDTAVFDQCKFYLSAFELKADTGLYTSVKKQYALVDAEDANSLNISLENIKAGTYSSLGFNIGVDSIANVSGAMNGALDPAKGMYWTWNTGYINAKLQGTSTACNTLHHAFEFHIGGYAPPFNAIREVHLPVSKLVVSKNKTSVIEINAAIDAWFSKPTPLKLTATNNVVIPGKDAMMIADNYAGMFSFK